MNTALDLAMRNLVLTRGVKNKQHDEWESSRTTVFLDHVSDSLGRFERGNWGDVDVEDWHENDEALKSLNGGGWYGRIIASYDDPRTERIWIIRQTTGEDGSQTVTVMFPSEY